MAEGSLGAEAHDDHRDVSAAGCGPPSSGPWMALSPTFPSSLASAVEADPSVLSCWRAWPASRLARFDGDGEFVSVSSRSRDQAG